MHYREWAGWEARGLCSAKERCILGKREESRGKGAQLGGNGLKLSPHLASLMPGNVLHATGGQKLLSCMSKFIQEFKQ